MLEGSTLEATLARAWEGIVELYSAPGVQTASLQLQDHYGVAVTPLLLTIVLSREGAGSWDTTTCAASVGHALEWERALTEPLRALRRNIGRFGFPNSQEPLLALKGALQRIEIESEYMSARLLLTHFTALPATQRPAHEAARHNILLLMQRHGCPATPETITALSIILHAAFPRWTKEEWCSTLAQYWPQPQG